MKKLFLFILFSFGLLLSYNAQAQWSNVGMAGFSAGTADYQSLAIDGSGMPYVAYRDDANGDKTTVMKYDGINWVNVGTVGFSAGFVAYPSLAIDGSGTPYVAYRDNTNALRTTVMKYDGTNWVNVGTAGFSAGLSSYQSLAIDGSGTPYVAYSDFVNSSKTTVMKYDGTNWVYVGTAGFSAGSNIYQSLAIDGSGTPYLAYRDGANLGKTTVMKYDGTNWVNVGTAGFSAGDSYDQSLAIDGSGTPYVAYRDYANALRTTVMKYDGTSWVNVGTAGFSASLSSYQSLAIDGSGTPYVAYRDAANSNKTTVMKFNCNTPLAGNYTINNLLPASTTNFIDFTSVRNKLCDCGTSGPVTLNVAANQTFTEQVDFCEVLGASSTNTITFNGNNATLTYGGGTGTAPWTMRMNGADHFTFKNLNISATGSTYGIAACFYDGASNNTIDSCNLSVTANASSQQLVPLALTTHPDTLVAYLGAGAACNYNLISNNTLEHGSANISAIGYFVGNQFINNKLKDSRFSGITLLDHISAVIRNNEIWWPTRTNGADVLYGILLNGSNNSLVEKNHIHDPLQLTITYGFTAIPLIASDNNDVLNNLVESISSDCDQTGISLSGNTNTCAHNTIVLDKSNPSGSYNTGISHYSGSSQISNNNIIVSRAMGAQNIGLRYSTLPSASNYNNAFVNGAANNYYGRNGATNSTTLANWQTATGLDANSLDVDPQFINPAIADYTPGNNALNAGTPIATIIDDINGTARSTTAPTIGAFEYQCAGPLAGTYTINNLSPTAGTNFNSFNDARAALCNCGIGAPVIFDVAAAQSFTEQVDFCEVLGASATNTITFNGNNATLSYGGGAYNSEWTMRLNGSDYFTFKNLNITATGASYGYAAYLYDGAKHNTIDSCNLTVPAYTSSSSHYPLYIAYCDSNVVQNSILESGYRNIYIQGISSDTCRGNKIIDNKLKDAYERGVYLDQNAQTLIQGNEIWSPTRTTTFTFFTMVHASYCNAIRIEKNHCHDPYQANPSSTSSSSGISLTTTRNSVVQNNLMESIHCLGDQYAITISGSNNFCAHNTLVLDDTQAGTGDTYGIRNYSNSSDIRNNNIYISRNSSGNKIGLYFFALAGVSDYNNVYLSGGGNNYYGYNAGTNITTIAAWKAATGLDLNSLDVDPQFVNPISLDYNPSNLALNNKGTPLGILDDFENEMRSTTTPDIGAFEFGCAGNSPIQSSFIATTDTTNCFGINDGQVNIQSTLGLSPYTYTLQQTNTTNSTGTFNGLAGGTYDVFIVDAQGCEDTISFNVQQNSTAVSISNITANNPNCFPGTNGSISISANGGAGNFQYDIGNGPQSNASFMNLGAASYNIAVTDVYGCSATSTVQLTAPGAPTIVSALSTNVSCNGFTDGSIAINATGTGTINYDLMPGNITNNSGQFNGLVANNYTISVSDAGGCTASTLISISQPTAVSITNATANNVSCNGQADGSINIAATGGTGTINYNLMPGNSTNSTGAFANLGPNNYTISATDANGCSATTLLNITQPTAVGITTATANNVSCNGQADGSINIAATGGTGTINYNLMPGNITNSTGAFANLGPNNYTISATDANGCIATTLVNITQPTAVSITNATANNVSCNGQADGSISIAATGGTGTINYNLMPGNITNSIGAFANLGPNNYTISATDANGCSASTAVVISEPTLLSLNLSNSSNPLCNGATTASIQVNANGGNGSNIFLLNPLAISNSTGLFNNLGAQAYSISVTDSKGCSSAITTNITEPAPITSNIVVDSVNCNGDASGNIQINTSGGTPAYNYLLQPGAVYNTTGIFPNLSAGIYSASITDANGCTYQSPSITVDEPTAISFASINITDVGCYGFSTGAINAKASGGTGNISYAIVPNLGSQTSAGNFAQLSAGNYTIIATDANGCTFSTLVSVSQNTEIVISNIVATEPICSYDQNGSLDIIVSGGSGAFQYSINNGNYNSNSTKNNLSLGNYFIQIKDALGCVIDSTIELNGPAPVQVSSFDLVHTTCKNTDDGEIYAVAIGGRGSSYTYTLNPGVFTNQSGLFNGLAVGKYTLQISDTAQCVWDTTVRVRLPNPLRLEITKQDLPCIGRGDEGNAMVIPTGGLPPYKYLWNSTPAQTTDQASLLRAGKYSVEVEDANGCIKRANTNIIAGDCCGEIFIPTAFSPNGDGNNDVFRILTTTGLDVFQLQIFNRWGQVVWGGSAITDAWDGTFKGEPVSMDTYFYTLSYLCAEDKQFHKKNGSLTLIR